MRPDPTGDGRWQISDAAGVEPRWGRDGKSLYYRNSTELYRAPVSTLHGFEAGRAERLFDRVATAGNIHSYAPGPDGRIFTPRSPDGRGSARTLYLDLDFARRLSESRHKVTP